ncbi:MAG TPA: hypothetical protein VGN63_06990 [Flavisolibacter sp.]|jgi:uncharacterized membrane protein|nr:hypothetical protein [Flavisolibacter sp.]
MNIAFSLHPKPVTTFLLKVIGFLALAGLVSCYLLNVAGLPSVFGLVPLFDLNEEFNIPSFYSGFAIWFSAFLLRSIYLFEKKNHGQSPHYWKALFFVFLFLGLDEIFIIHEKFARIEPYLRDVIHIHNANRYWVIPYGVFTLVAGLYFLPFYLRLQKATRLRFTVAGLVYVSAAFGLEIISSMVASIVDLSYLAIDLFEAAEEIIEMLGIALFIRALLYYFLEKGITPSVSLKVQMESRKQDDAKVQIKEKPRTLASEPQ